MWETFETVLYVNTGLCRIEDIRCETFAGESRTYYVLRPLQDSKSLVYVPTDNEMLLKKMHKLMTKEEVQGIISEFNSLTAEWIDHDKLRADFFKKTLESGDRRKIAGMIHTLLLKKQEVTEKGKKLRAADEALLSQGEKTLLEEFSFVLGQDVENIMSLFNKVG